MLFREANMRYIVFSYLQMVLGEYFKDLLDKVMNY